MGFKPYMDKLMWVLGIGSIFAIYLSGYEIALFLMAEVLVITNMLLLYKINKEEKCQ